MLLGCHARIVILHAFVLFLAVIQLGQRGDLFAAGEELLVPVLVLGVDRRLLCLAAPASGEV